MLKPHVLIKPTPSATRIFARMGEDEILRAALPPPQGLHPRAAATLLEGLSLWYQRPLSAVLCADAEDASSALGLCDGFGFGQTTVHYAVEVFDARRPRQTLGCFADLRQLDLRLRGLR